MSIIQERISEVFGQGIENKAREAAASDLLRLFGEYLSNKKLATKDIVEAINRVILDLSEKDKAFAKILSKKLQTNYKDIHETFHFVEIQ